ncbi:DUF1837 domain-containing protein [Chryseobacterium taklimakanense]|uniref:HamA C-terminal domain-containing protein n=1 Tax=Chryseobacterium group TaxID=2782232 RepID=UPI000F5F23C1|nr:MULTISPECIES: DUF1837 domain-containing protein [Chryseobacterium group]AZI22491.1 DUF1837 domain-containing protein [Chryseobacterium taklimakanense]
MLERSIQDGFLDLFYHDMKDQVLDNKNSLNLFVLKLKNNAFAYDELIEELGNSLCHFALSRKSVRRLVEEQKYKSLVDTAKERLRNHNVNEGELGEILLFCILESFLNAPKILTKLELKTSNNDYVKGADGVHLLKIDDKNYQLIFGESKLESNIRSGIYSAFSSINTFLTQKGKSKYEIELLNSQLAKETFDENGYEVLRKIIIPSAKDEETYLDYSFGIFLGFNIDIDEEEKKKDFSEFRTIIREKIKNHVSENLASINTQLKKGEFTGYKFYIYVIPFSDLQNTRKEIIKQITS